MKQIFSLWIFFASLHAPGFAQEADATSGSQLLNVTEKGFFRSGTRE